MKENEKQQKTEIDYTILYAEKLKADSSIFAQQKILIESQLHASSSLFKSMFAGNDFKKLARKYLRETGLLS